ncbi:hypothetical protein AVDCRST_MAG84-3125, partial [uncultured Microcoleus sp.]
WWQKLFSTGFGERALFLWPFWLHLARWRPARY